MAADRSRPFDVTRPPLLRCTLVRYQDGSADLILTMHHMLIDGWSMPILARDLAELYAGRGAGLPAAPPYRDYLAWLAGTDESAALNLLAALSHHADFSVGCYCADESRCHRSVLRALLLERRARLK
jgi:hypothetical protein